MNVVKPGTSDNIFVLAIEHERARAIVSECGRRQVKYSVFFDLAVDLALSVWTSDEFVQQMQQHNAGPTQIPQPIRRPLAGTLFDGEKKNRLGLPFGVKCVQPVNGEQMFTMSDVAQQSGLAESTVNNCVLSGELGCYRPNGNRKGTRVLIPLSAYAEWSRNVRVKMNPRPARRK